MKNIGRDISEQVGESFVPNLKLLQSSLYNVVQAFGHVAPAAAGDDSAAPGPNDAAPAAGGPSAVASGEVRSRQDVMQTLERLCEYLSRSEPTNPVQLVLRRAQRMMNMSFLELMQDMAPDGLGQAEKVVGERLNKDE